MMNKEDIKCSPGNINELDLPPFELGAVQLLDGALNVFKTSKLHHSLVLGGLVSFGPGHLSSCTLHVGLQVPPVDPAGDVVHEDPVLRAGALLPPVLGSPGVPAGAAKLRNKSKTLI